MISSILCLIHSSGVKSLILVRFGCYSKNSSSFRICEIFFALNFWESKIRNSPKSYGFFTLSRYFFLCKSLVFLSVQRIFYKCKTQFLQIWRVMLRKQNFFTHEDFSIFFEKFFFRIFFSFSKKEMTWFFLNFNRTWEFQNKIYFHFIFNEYSFLLWTLFILCKDH